MGGPPASWPQGGGGAASLGAATSAGISGGGMGYPSSWPAGPAYGASYGGQGEGTPPPNYDDAWLAHDISQILQSYAQGQQPQRSEEHTSELQSLMRNSYAVFC